MTHARNAVHALPEVEALYRTAAAELRTALCHGTFDNRGEGPLLDTPCEECGPGHDVQVNVQALRRHIIRVNAAAHGLIKTLLPDLSLIERQQYHDGVLPISREHFPAFAGLIARKESLLRERLHLRSRVRRAERNHAVELLLESDEVSQEDLLRFMDCYRKCYYADEPAALAALQTGIHSPVEEYVVYACRHCDGYHVGHPQGHTTPLTYRISRAKMFWGVNRDAANRFVETRGLLN